MHKPPHITINGRTLTERQAIGIAAAVAMSASMDPSQAPPEDRHRAQMFSAHMAQILALLHLEPEPELQVEPEPELKPEPGAPDLQLSAYFHPTTEKIRIDIDTREDLGLKRTAIACTHALTAMGEYVREELGDGAWLGTMATACSDLARSPIVIMPHEMPIMPDWLAWADDSRAEKVDGLSVYELHSRLNPGAPPSLSAAFTRELYKRAQAMHPSDPADSTVIMMGPDTAEA